MNSRYVLAIHGGAGTIGTSGAHAEGPYHEGLLTAIRAGEAVLADGGSALDAVLASVVALEDCPLFNAGRGAAFAADASHELDAGVMDGSSLAAGAITGARRVRNPIQAAHEVMRRGECVLMAGPACDLVAEEAGLTLVDASYFSTPERLAQLRAVQTSRGQGAVLDHDGQSVAQAADGVAIGAHQYGTVGAVARDRQGNLAAATSTGGMTNKRPGRVGDTPIVGAGVYANNLSCAVSCTGTGEAFLRTCVAFDIHARVRYLGEPLASAAHHAVHHEMAALGGRGGVIAIGRDGSLAFPYNSTGMYRGWVREGDAPSTAIFDHAANSQG